jgi:hypothetical protein
MSFHAPHRKQSVSALQVCCLEYITIHSENQKNRKHNLFLKYPFLRLKRIIDTVTSVFCCLMLIKNVFEIKSVNITGWYAKSTCLRGTGDRNLKALSVCVERQIRPVSFFWQRLNTRGTLHKVAQELIFVSCDGERC